VCADAPRARLRHEQTATFARVARILRSAFPLVGVYHLTTRGVDGAPIVRDREDGLAFLTLVRQETRRFALDPVALCLMPNHYHLIVDGRRDRISRALHRLNGIYAQRFNERHGRRGHLWGDRFWTELIDSEEHLQAACRYVLDNPLRAGLCDTRAAWPWLGCRYGLELE
jgi:REP element-mobilizing transposase RayT